jgi:hypothetical protein
MFLTFSSSIGNDIWAGGMSCANLPMRLTSRDAGVIGTGEVPFLIPPEHFHS